MLFQLLTCHVLAMLLCVLQSIPHGLLDINRLHSMPSKQQLVATCCDEPQIYLFDLQQQAELQQQQQQGSLRSSSSKGGSGSGSDSEDDKVTASQKSGDDSAGSGCSKQPSEAVAAVLGGREAGGYALEWNPGVPGLLLAADVGGGVQLYDVERGSSSNSSGQAEIQPQQVGLPDIQLQ
jgi:hypothetical protein